MSGGQSSGAASTDAAAAASLSGQDSVNNSPATTNDNNNDESSRHHPNMIMYQQSPESTEATWPNYGQNAWGGQEQQQQQQYQNQLYFLQQDLEHAYQREQALLYDLHNLTASSSDLQNRERLHMHQLDVLTERVLEIENAAAADRNLAIEYRNNCTELAHRLAGSEQEMDEWKAKCSELAELRTKDADAMQEVKTELRRALLRAEELAAMVERHRLHEEGEVYRASSIRKKKKVGFFAWLFGFGGTSIGGGGGSGGDDEYEEMHDLARSTLLEALRSERNSVNELEAAVATLQQNNSAIAEQVLSRDQIIDELNARVDVFEEDKLVLKAALRQLQKEMSEEAPKSQKLVDDFEATRGEVERLKKEITSLVASHKAEIGSLQKVIKKKQEKIRATETNLTVIGTYVDKLEERLADFTVARRDIEQRETDCKNLEKKATDAENAAERLERKVEELEKEHEELKKLLEELVEERSKLQKEKDNLIKERSVLNQNIQSLRQSYAKLDNEAKSLKLSADQWQSRATKLEENLNITISTNEDLRKKLDCSESEKMQLQQQMQGDTPYQMEKQRTLDEAVAAKEVLERRIVAVEQEKIAKQLEYESFVRDMKQRVELQQREIEIALQEKENAVAESRNAAAKVAELDALRQQADALMKQEREKYVARLKDERERSEKGLEAERARIEDQIRQLALKRETTAMTEETLTADRSVGIARTAASATDIRVTSEQPIVNQAPNSTKVSDATIRGQVPVNTTKLPEGAPPRLIRPPYLPREANAPRRAFGSGLLKPKRKEISPENSVSGKSGTLVFAGMATPPKRKVAFRKLRKLLSKTTGLHGVLTPQSRPRPKKEQLGEEVAANLPPTRPNMPQDIASGMNSEPVPPTTTPTKDGKPEKKR
jgi:DNA repair exonuclease SbcCD ATPase subunit